MRKAKKNKELKKGKQLEAQRPLKVSHSDLTITKVVDKPSA